MNGASGIRLRIAIAFLISLLCFKPTFVLAEAASQAPRQGAVETKIEACSKSHFPDAATTGESRSAGNLVQSDAETRASWQLILPQVSSISCAQDRAEFRDAPALVLAGGNRAPPAFRA